MSLTRQQAHEKLCEWVGGESLRKHCRAVEIVMTKAAEVYGDVQNVALRRLSVEQWGIAGLLHDADYEQYPTEHPGRIVSWVREQGEDEIAHAISAHHTKWGVPYVTMLDRSLLACDELTGFVMACCLVQPAGISSLRIASVMKKLKDSSFAAKIDRAEINAGAAMLAVSLESLIEMVIDALKPHAFELGIEGRKA